MMDLMAVGKESGAIPLYMHAVQRVLRDLREIQQSEGSQFDYAEFKRRILSSGLLPGQLEPLKQRLDALESFMPLEQVNPSKTSSTNKSKVKSEGSSWIPKVGL
jgi:heterodisulfide reductase subunit C